MISFFVVVSLFFGLILGSFLNALAYRLPRKESLMTRSHCTSCFKQIHAWENIPVISWLFLRGRCSGCKEPISLRYPLVELGTGLAFAFLSWRALDMSCGCSFLFTLLIFLSFAFVGIFITLIDLDSRRIPSEAVFSGLIVVLLGVLGYQIASGDSSRSVSGLASMAIYFIVYFLLWLFRPGAIGYGDVRLAGLTGLVLGWVSVETAILGFFLPWFLAMIWLIPSIVKKEKNSKTAIPFGPWMILGTLVAIVFGDILIGYYLRLGGI